MRVGIVIPWRPDGHERERNKAVVAERLTAMLPEATYVEADSHHNPFSRAGSRNAGVRRAQGDGCGVVVICDADSIPEEGPLQAALEAAGDGRLHLPYTRLRSLSARGTKDYLRGQPAERCRALLDWDQSVGGCLVITPDAYWKAGGQDERFTDWGCEDTAFKIDCDRELGPSMRHPGVLIHLYHPARRKLSEETLAQLRGRV